MASMSLALSGNRICCSQCWDERGSAAGQASTGSDGLHADQDHARLTRTDRSNIIEISDQEPDCSLDQLVQLSLLLAAGSAVSCQAIAITFLEMPNP